MHGLPGAITSKILCMSSAIMRHNSLELGDDLSSCLNDFTIIFFPIKNCFSFKFSTFVQDLLTPAIINIIRCKSCIWGCKMAVEMIIDQWNPGRKKYRYETFCYGPKSCSFYKAGPTRKVPGRKVMSWTEEDWVDEGATSHRSMDE